jgi:mono/diheme cytochrome c family protein
MRTLLTWLWHAAALIGVVALVAGAWFWRQGISTRTPPLPIEVSLARAARLTMIPADARRRPNPLPADEAHLRVALEHWADHCASCHANDGSGETAMGQGLYPRAPDMRLPATQRLSDGELFHIIEHGVKLTGMPAWGTGTAEGEVSSWQLVHFIRRLPTLTEEEIAEMEDLNPRSLHEWHAFEEERRFLRGEPLPPASPDTDHRHEPPR